MGVLMLGGPGGSPGVTTTALGLALTWPRPVILAECDPAGGSVLAGLWRGESDAGGAGLLVRVAVAAQRDPAAAAGMLEDEALFLGGGGHARLLPAPPGPDTGRQLAGAWAGLAAAFACCGRDVICDVGRLDDGGTLEPLLTTAALALMVCRPSLRQAAAADPRLDMLAPMRPADGLVVIGQGDYTPDTLARQFAVRVAGILPSDPAAASVLSDGAATGRRFMRARLMIAARGLAGQLARELDTPGELTLPDEVRQL
jgi:hypothetical protein